MNNRNSFTSSAFPSLRRSLRRHRRLIAAGLAALAVVLFAQGMAPAAAKTQPIAVATSGLAAGTVLTAADVTVKPWPAEFASGSAYSSPSDAIGRVLSGPLSAGEPIGPSRVVGPAMLALGNTSGDEPLVAAAVRLADSGEAALLRPGDRVDVLAATSSALSGTGESRSATAPADVVASGVQVITVPGQNDSGGSGGMLGSGPKSSAADGAMIVLAVTPATASALAGASARARLSVTLRPQ